MNFICLNNMNTSTISMLAMRGDVIFNMTSEEVLFITDNGVNFFDYETTYQNLVEDPSTILTFLNDFDGLIFFYSNEKFIDSIKFAEELVEKFGTPARMIFSFGGY